MPMRPSIRLVAALALGMSTGHAAVFAETGPAADAAIRAGVDALGYPAEVGDACVGLASNWPIDDWQARLADVRGRLSGGTATATQAGEVEGQVVDELRRRLVTAIQQSEGASAYYHLGPVLADRKAQCLGNCQLWFVLGNAVGLDVRPIEVKLPPLGTLPENETHVAAVVRLADGRVRMVDTRFSITALPVRFKDVYRRDGTGWELSDTAGRTMLHRRIRLLDASGLEAALLLNIANGYRRAAKESEAGPLYARALALDPNSVALHLAVAESSFLQGLWDDADAEIRAALALDPKDASAHAALGRLFARQNRWKEAITEFDRALALKPNAPNTRADRAAAIERAANAPPVAPATPGPT